MNRHAIGRFLLLTLSASVFGLWASPVLSCSCTKIGPACEAAWLEADAVFVGRVYWSSLLPTKHDGVGTLHRLVKIQILEPFIGNLSGWITVETGAGGGDCGYDFSLGTKYVIYAHRQKDGSLYTSICTRTRRVSDAEADLAYLRIIKTLSPKGKVYGTVMQYTFDPNFKPKEIPISSPYGGPENQLFSMRSLSATVVHLRGASSGELTASAGQSGEFAFQDLAPGNYRISVDLPEHMKPWEEREIRVPAQGCFEVNIRTAFNGRVAGRVTDKSGAPVPYVAVEVVRASEVAEAERGFRWQNADKDGAFELGPLPPDVYVIGVNIVKYSGSRERPRTYYPGTSELASAQRIRVGEGQLVKELNFRLEAHAHSASSH